MHESALILLPILLLACAAGALAVGMLVMGGLLGPKRSGPVKRMPYESGMDPVHHARRRFDVRFHLVAIAFLIFDVELLFLYPWAVASKHRDGFSSLAGAGFSRNLVFFEVLLFIALLTAAFLYAWRKGVFRWR
jgi:NADH-quinone oxidoreductase subunit A